MAAARRTAAPEGLPARDEILRFIRESGRKIGKRDIAKAFGLKGAQRAALGALLRDLAASGAIERSRGRRMSAAGHLPSVTVIEIAEVDVDGDVYARPANWTLEEAPPRIRVVARPGGTAPGVGDRVLARLKLAEDGVYDAQPMRLVGTAPNEVLGVYEQVGSGGRLVPTDRKVRTEFAVEHSAVAGLADGELVIAEVLGGRRLGLPRVRVIDRLGHLGDPRSFSLISIHTHGIPTTFAPAALAEAEAARPPGLSGRADLRTVPLITIDPSDARDHDDAVWAEPDDAPDNKGGWHVIVAIADVAHYVRPGGAVDAEARRRGVSAYFPDRMVPMLPPLLVTERCSLVPDADRPCFAAHLWFDAEGNRLRHRFERAIMRSAARLTYEQVQAARDGRPDEAIRPLLDSVIGPLYAAFAALDRERNRRAPLDIALPERRIVLGEDGHVLSVAPQPHFESHRLIEEFMIAANIAAAETLEQHRTPCMYRVHDTPDPEKLEALREVLDTVGLSLPRGQTLRPREFNRVLRHAAGTPHERLVNEIVLRSQSQATYSPQNIGHFGLSLRRYAHFTSPIRRYADVLVHRALISALGFGKDGLPADDAAGFKELGEQVSAFERRAEAAEREASDRYLAAFMADRLGAEFAGHITGATRFGLFVALDETGAQGLVPMRDLGAERFDHVPERHAVVGQRSRRAYTMGDAVAVRLAEVNIVTGSLRFELLTDPDARRTPPRSGRPRALPRSRRRR